MRSVRVFTSRRVYESVSVLAEELGCSPAALLPYLKRCDDSYELKPLNELKYRMWHHRVHQQGEPMPYDRCPGQRGGIRYSPHLVASYFKEPEPLQIGEARPDEPEAALLLCWAGALQGRTELYEFYLDARDYRYDYALELTL